MATLADPFARNLNYLRVSVTDRCNLRCTYCMPADMTCLPQDTLLTDHEIVTIVQAMSTLGLDTVRITGGEPLVRQGCSELIGRLKALPSMKRVLLTTNGVYLNQHIHELARHGIDGINISLDAVERDVYTTITGRDYLDAVLAGIHQAVELGIKVKLNCVALKSINESQIAGLADFANKLPVDVKFIELMPSGACQNIEGITGQDVRSRLSTIYGELHPHHNPNGLGPATYYKTPTMRGSVGFIEPMSHSFCATCNRLRLTAEGYLRLCLYHNDGVNLKDMLRGGADATAIATAIQTAVKNKPKQHHFNEKAGFETMSNIGG